MERKMILLILVQLLLFSSFANARDNFLNVLIKNSVGQCEYCFAENSIDIYSFGQCPNTKENATRFNLIKHDIPYVYSIETQTKPLILDGNEEFYIFPVFNDKRVMISSTLKRKCLTNDLSFNNTPPYQNNIISFFSDCDYTGNNNAQIFSLVNYDSLQFIKYKITVYFADNPRDTDGGTLVSNSVLSNLDSSGYYFYLTYINSSDDGRKFRLPSNNFEISIPSMTPTNLPYFIFSNYLSIAANYCYYSISFRNLASLTIPYFNMNRCVDPSIIELAMDKLNNVTFKIINATKNVYETTSLIQTGSTITFTATSHTAKYAPYTYTNIPALSQFNRYLEYGDFNIGLTLSDPTLWKYTTYNFTVDTCNYLEIKIPIYENVFVITFRITTEIETSTASEATDRFVINSNIVITRTENGQTYSYTNSSAVFSFQIIDVLYGNYTFSPQLANPNGYEFIDALPLSFVADSDKTVTIRLRKLFARLEFYENTVGVYTNTLMLLSGSTIMITNNTSGVQYPVSAPSSTIDFINVDIPPGDYAISLTFINNSVFTLLTTSFTYTVGQTTKITYKENFVLVNFNFATSPGLSPLTTDIFPTYTIKFKNNTINYEVTANFTGNLSSIQVKLHPGTFLATEQVYTLDADYEYISGLDFSLSLGQNPTFQILVKTSVISGSNTFTLSDMWDLQNSTVSCPAGYGLTNFTMSGSTSAFTISFKCRTLPGYSSASGQIQTPWNEKQLNTGFHFLDRHTAYCSSNQAMGMWKVAPHPSISNQFAILYTCYTASISCTGQTTALWGMSGYSMGNLIGMSIDLATSGFIGGMQIVGNWQTSQKYINYLRCTPNR